MLIDANIFQPLINVFEAVLKFFHTNVGGSWGWSIVLLTVCVRLILMPLMLRQFHSMQRMQSHMPELKALQTKYKEDKQRQQQEMMKFYKENNINPFASCLPLVLQLPVFLSLFYMLKKNLRTDICPKIQHAFQTKYAAAHPAATHATVVSQTTACGTGPHSGAGFLFIHDLTNTAHGLTLVVLLVLYVGTQMASTVIMSAPTMDQNQRRMMMFLPLIFVLFIIRFPAGLIVYWITTNGWTMAQQFVFKQRIKYMQPKVAGGGTDLTTVAPPTQDRGGPAKKSPATKSSAAPAKRSSVTPKKNGANGGGDPPAGGLGGLIRGAAKNIAPKPPKSDTPAATGGGRATPPPSPPRKKKKRSGRRR
jgi:YidC/Oxa1 family membrane protein insertase